MFDQRGNQGLNNYEVQGLRGGKIYKGPIGWVGHDLNVINKYDGGNNTGLGIHLENGVKHIMVLIFNLFKAFSLLNLKQEEEKNILVKMI